MATQPTSTTANPTSSADSAALKELLKEVTEMDRITAINSIMKSIKVNPIDILQLPIEYTDEDIKKQYKHLSRLVHPDRIKNELYKESAIKAFAKLADAKKLLIIESNEKDNPENESVKFVKNLKRQIIEAKRRIIARKHNNSNNNDNNNDDMNNINLNEFSDEPPLKRQKLLKSVESNDNKEKCKDEQNETKQNNNESNNDTGNNSNNMNNNNNDKNESDKNDIMNDKILITEEEWKEELRQVITSDEWNKHLSNKATERRDIQERRRREEIKAKREAEIERVKQWEAGTNARVNSWRNFKSKGKKSKKKGKKRGFSDL